MDSIHDTAVGVVGFVLDPVHPNDAAPGRAGGAGQRHRRKPAHGRPGDLDWHPDRHLDRNLPCRVRHQDLAGRNNPLYQRHSALGAFDCDRPFCLRHHCRQGRQFLRLFRCYRTGPHRHSGGGAHHREHAFADPEQPARSRLCTGRPTLESDYPSNCARI